MKIDQWEIHSIFKGIRGNWESSASLDWGRSEWGSLSSVQRDLYLALDRGQTFILSSKTWKKTFRGISIRSKNRLRVWPQSQLQATRGRSLAYTRKNFNHDDNFEGHFWACKEFSSTLAHFSWLLLQWSCTSSLPAKLPVDLKISETVT